MDFGEAVAISGGQAGDELMAERLTGETTEALRGALAGVSSITQSMLDQVPQPNQVRLVVTRSTSPQVRFRRLDPGDSLVLVPLGLLGRVQALARRLLWHLEQDVPDVAVVGSALDERDGPWEPAPGLVPVFGEDGDQDEDDYWEALGRFDLRTPPDEDREVLVTNFVVFGFICLVAHELTHVVVRHDDVLRLARAKDPRIPERLDITRLRRGMEIQADVIAGENFTRFLLLDPAVAEYYRHDPAIAVYVASFVQTMLFGMYDVHRKTIYEYDEGIYPHPLIRYEFAADAMESAVTAVRPELLEEARQNAYDGWLHCVMAFNALEWACFEGMYGTPPPGSGFGTERYVPITTLKYGAAAALRPNMLQDSALSQEVADLTHRLLFT